MSLLGTAWAPIGPSPINQGGRADNGLVSAIAVHPANTDILYIGTAGGGVWRSNDGGNNWTPTFDRQLSLAIGEPGALAIDPSSSDTIYAGTSGRLIFRTFNNDTGSFSPVQAGLFKSSDGGASWIRLGAGFPAGNTGNAGQFVNTQINVIRVDPANGRNLYLACSNGVFLSTDGGRNWTQGANASGDTLSLVLDSTSPPGARILYAGISGQGVFQSTDGGRNWAAILSIATPALAAALGTPPPGAPARGFGRFSVGLAPPLSPANPAGVQVLYATMEGTPVTTAPAPPGAPNPVGLFRSIDRGATWTQRGAAGMPPVTYGGYCLDIAVDPASPGDGNADTIYYGNRDQAVSTDSGTNFTAIGGLHSDTHAWAFIAQPAPGPSIVLCGTDGGIARSADRGLTWTMLNTGGLQTSLFYNIDIRPDPTGSVTVGALQDNALETTAGGAGAGWNAGGGDGFDVAYDSAIAGQVYGCHNVSLAPNTRIFRSNDDGQSFPTDITPWGTATDQGLYLAPVATDPGNGGTVYALGNQNLWQSRDSGGTWRIVDPGLPAGGNHIDIAPASASNVVIAVGTKVRVSTNALAAAPVFIDITGDLPTRNVARAVFDPVDPTILYAVLGGLNGGGTRDGHVFRTTIGATAWTDISPPLDIPFSAIVLDGADTPPAIYAGTEFGVLRSVDTGASWSILDDLHFPHVPVLDLALRNGLLRAGTYGRGVFAFVRPTGPSIAVSPRHGLAFGAVCDGPHYLELEIFNVGAQDLIVGSVQRLMGSTDFSVLSSPGTPVVVAPGEAIEFTIAYAPSAPGAMQTALIRIASNDPAAPLVDLAATGRLGAGALATAIADGGNFGDVCLGAFADEALTLDNAGPCPLAILAITSNSADFIAPGVAALPLRLAAGAALDLAVRFQPTSFGAKAAILTLVSSDPASPHRLALSGNAPPPRLNLLIADGGNFGHVCLGAFADQPLTLTNSGRCTLSITAIAASDAAFLPPDVAAYPLTIAPGTALAVPIRFQPAGFGATAATITVTSDDPGGPRSLAVSGFAPSGKLAVTGSLCFGGVRACCAAERTLSICNVGDCALHVASVAFKRRSRHWKLVHNPFPATLHPGACLGVVVRYKADETCPRACELVIRSDDPDRPRRTLDVLAHTVWHDHHCKQCGKDNHHGCGCDRCPPDCCDDDDDRPEHHADAHADDGADDDD